RPARLSRGAGARSRGDGRLGDLAGAREPHPDPGLLDLREWRLRRGHPGQGPLYHHRGNQITPQKHHGATTRDAHAMAQEELLKDLRRRMDGAIEVLRKEIGGLRTGRASASLLEPVQVPAYGSTVPLAQVASVNVPEPRMITVQVWDGGVVKAVDMAIREAW